MLQTLIDSFLICFTLGFYTKVREEQCELLVAHSWYFSLRTGIKSLWFNLLYWLDRGIVPACAPLLSLIALYEFDRADWLNRDLPFWGTGLRDIDRDSTIESLAGPNAEVLAYCIGLSSFLLAFSVSRKLFSISWWRIALSLLCCFWCSFTTLRLRMRSTLLLTSAMRSFAF